MIPLINQADKAVAFHALHHTDTLLLFPNIWDPLSAILLEQLGYPAVATASAAVAYVNGYQDGEHFPLSQALGLFEQLVRSVRIPVSVDIESGYSTDAGTFKATIKALIETGVVGINLEDSDPRTGQLLPTAQQASRIQLVKQVSRDMDIPLFINARTDVYRVARTRTAGEQLAETIKRGEAYREAGADCIYPILVTDEDAIRTLVNRLRMPINILLTDGGPDVRTLQQLGVRRVSTGPAFLGVALKAIIDVGASLGRHEGQARLLGDAESLKGLAALFRKRAQTGW